MDLQTYIAAERGNATRLAAALGIPAGYLSQMASGDRAVTPQRAARIEVVTDKQVRRWDCRPGDWWEIWPELIGAEGAPAVPATPQPADQAA